MARKRKATVRREPNGQAQRQRVSADQIRALAICNRVKHSGVSAAEATDALAGFTLGVLRLRGRASASAYTGEISDPTGISDGQFQAGEKWSQIFRRHRVLQGHEVKDLASPSFQHVEPGSSVFEPLEATILRNRAQFVGCYDALALAARLRGFRVMTATYDICIANKPIQSLTEADIRYAKIGLTALAAELGTGA